MTIEFQVREPVGKNATFKRGKGRRLYRDPEAEAFRQRVVWEAMKAAKESAWPRDPWLPAAVRVTVALRDTKHDAGACDTLITDAMQGVLYANDRIVSHGPQELPVADGLGRRAIVTVELLAVRSPDEAVRLRVASEKRRIARARKLARTMGRAS